MAPNVPPTSRTSRLAGRSAALNSAIASSTTRTTATTTRSLAPPLYRMRERVFVRTREGSWAPGIVTGVWYREASAYFVYQVQCTAGDGSPAQDTFLARDMRRHA
ncbi:hypothetical protein ONZ51_g2643 [Trametes cubensis]|uniref:Uncharacterized protein n=1 Tax=Trametes cubensis TaxID=1111947 RepID=A0AAD7U1P5_9APHY|nr:hypothetical protein ONZ51_g2643 [Trametes cubensis]